MPTTETKYRYSGHETFVCRYAWLPKVVAELSANPCLFSEEDVAMVRLGIGKNMVRSARFWAEAAGIIEERAEGGLQVSKFGQELLGQEWYDPYLEQLETLWLLHWKISTNPTRPLFHWEQMLNYWHRPEFSESEVIPFLQKALPRGKEKTSSRTLSDGFKVFTTSYVASRANKGEATEDALDCPLVELGLIQVAGERLTSTRHRETIYSFNIEPKPSISPQLFAYCLHDFWLNSPKYRDEHALSFRAISTEMGSPGQVFKLPETALNPLLDELSDVTDGGLIFEESSSLQQVWVNSELSQDYLFENIYSTE